MHVSFANDKEGILRHFVKTLSNAVDEAFLLRYFAPGENQPSPGSVAFSQEKFLTFNVDYTGAINKPYQIWESYKPPFPVATPENFLVHFY